MFLVPEQLPSFASAMIPYAQEAKNISRPAVRLPTRRFRFGDPKPYLLDSLETHLADNPM